MIKTSTLELLLAALVGFAALPPFTLSTAFGQATEPPAKKSKLDVPEEEEAPPAKKSKLDAPEEEAPPPKKPGGKPLPGTEEEAPPKRTTPSAAAPGAASEEGEEEAVRVCDVMFVNQRAMKVRLWESPFPFPLPKDRLDETFRLPRLPESSDKEKSVAYFHAKGADINGVSYYEDRMWLRAAEAMGFTNEATKRRQLAEPGAVFDLSSLEAQKRADKAEQILTTAISEHDSAVQANKRKGTQWDEKFGFRRNLVQALLNLRLNRTDLLLKEGQTEAAQRSCDQLLADFGDSEVARNLIRSRLERIFLAQAEQAVQTARQAAAQENQAAGYAEARRLLDELARRFPRESSTSASDFRQELIKQAKSLVAEAEALPMDRARDAKMLLARASVIWPDLPGLESKRQQWDDQYRILHCAYGSLPQNVSPFLASTPVERHAVSLMFESLVRWWDGKAEDQAEGEGGHFEPQLAQTRPVPLSRGRQFYLHETHWSDSTSDSPHVLTFADVQHTVKLLGTKSIPGHLPAWAELVRRDVQQASGDHLTACIWLERDHWQPLSLMDFKILPRASFKQGTPEELAAFNKRPVGTGPYILGESLNSEQARFVANPQYRKAGKPHINEIVFHRLTPTQAVAQFLQRQIHLVYDVQPEQVAQIRQQRRTVRTLDNHSVWFLAPRYSRQGSPSALDDMNLRLAIAHAIDREKILDQFYRVGSNADHQALTGPYPKNSWAYNKTVPGYKPTNVPGLVQKAAEALKTIPPLRLIFPDNDPATANACSEIQKQIEDLNVTPKLKVTLTAVPPEKYAETLEAGTFDLAYWRHDFKDQSYWLWPLLDPGSTGKGGANFMRYEQDSTLKDLFTQVVLHKHFPDIRKLTHNIHEHIYKQAIVIPLWQLDTYVAVDEALTVRLDPWVLYGNVEEWDLKLRTK